MARGKKRNANSTALTDPETRKEIFMAKAAGLIESAPSVPYTREERYWLAIIEAINRGGAGDMKIEDYDPNGVVAEAGGIPAYVSASGGGFTPENNAGAHNAIYRGKNLGTSVTSAQYDAIDAGTFEDLFIGDYWTMGDINWRIAAFDYYYKTGTPSVEKHHVVIVPDTNLGNAQMNTTDDTSDGYTRSSMYAINKSSVYPTIINSFGEAHLMSHQYALVSEVTNNVPSSITWVGEAYELMTESNVFGSRQRGVTNDGTNAPLITDIDNSQFPLFMYRPDLKSNGQNYWFRDIVSGNRYASMAGSGACSSTSPTTQRGIRPAFSICK